MPDSKYQAALKVYNKFFKKVSPGPWYLQVIKEGAGLPEGDWLVYIRAAKGAAGNPNLGPWVAQVNTYRMAKNGTADARVMTAAPLILGQLVQLLLELESLTETWGRLGKSVDLSSYAGPDKVRIELAQDFLVWLATEQGGTLGDV